MYIIAGKMVINWSVTGNYFSVISGLAIDALIAVRATHQGQRKKCSRVGLPYFTFRSPYQLINLTPHGDYSIKCHAILRGIVKKISGRSRLTFPLVMNLLFSTEWPRGFPAAHQHAAVAYARMRRLSAMRPFPASGYCQTRCCPQPVRPEVRLPFRCP